MEKEKALVIYVDLWENVEEASPAKKVLDKVRYFLTESAWLEALKVHLSGVSLTFERKQIGGPDGMSLAEVFSELAAKVDVNIVLIIDEIQETLKSNHGRNLLAALKAARDAVNLRPHNPHDTYLFIVGTGSHRSVVTAMASRPSQPFYGADRMDFPVLGDEFIRWQAAQLPEDAKKPTEDALKKGFAILGCRPKVFRQMLAEIQHYSGADIDGVFLTVCSNQARTDAEEFLMPIYKSDLVTRLLFTEIAKAGDVGCRNLFSTAFLSALSEKTGRSKVIQASSVQSKLAAMQKKDWIYPISHGNYAVSDPQAARVWLDNLEDNCAF